MSHVDEDYDLGEEIIESDDNKLYDNYFDKMRFEKVQCEYHNDTDDEKTKEEVKLW